MGKQVAFSFLFSGIPTSDIAGFCNRLLSRTIFPFWLKPCWKKAWCVENAGGSRSRGGIRHRSRLAAGVMKVNELFYSIQGESSFAGRPCAFIRLTGCNLRCAWCDTQYAFFEGTEMSVPEIIRAIDAYPTRLALVTGGEPMLQKDVHELFATLIDRGCTVLLETGGHEPLAAVDARVHKIVDFKCPSSGMSGRNDYANADCLTRKDEVKFVIADRNDFEWACSLVRKFDLTARAGTVHFSPVFGTVHFAELAAWILECGLDVRMQPQLHKIIWPETSRGV